MIDYCRESLFDKDYFKNNPDSKIIKNKANPLYNPVNIKNKNNIPKTSKSKNQFKIKNYT